jgi:DNA topoisomerase III
MFDGKTSPPGYLTEPELIALMDANGIGTDATMADHIAKIKERSYVMTRTRGTESGQDGEGTRGGRAGRGRGRGDRGGRNVSGPRSGGGVQEFIPTTLGVALIEGYDNVGFETSLSKPFLRKEVFNVPQATDLGYGTYCNLDGTSNASDLRRDYLSQRSGPAKSGATSRSLH